MTSTYLVLGGTGKTGRRTTRRLVEAGLTARPGARTPAAPAPGTSPVRFDWDDRSSWGPALDGVEGAYLVPPAFRTDHAPLLGELAGQAADLGVSRLVLLSARGVDQGPDNPLRAAEQAVRAAAGDRAAVTVLRPSWFMQNFTEAFFAPGVAEGQLVSPTGDGAEPFIDAEDIAAVAVAALTEAGHGGRDYDLSGPAALTMAEAAEVLSSRLGHRVEHVDPPLEQWTAGAVQNGLPATTPACSGRCSAGSPPATTRSCPRACRTPWAGRPAASRSGPTGSSHRPPSSARPDPGARCGAARSSAGRCTGARDGPPREGSP
jgi:uncharacterized protein YbjT (DUF2867 family)